MPKFGQKCDMSGPGNEARMKNRILSAVAYAAHGQTQDYKDRKKREYQRRKLHRAALCSAFLAVVSSDNGCNALCDGNCCDGSTGQMSTSDNASL